MHKFCNRCHPLTSPENPLSFDDQPLPYASGHTVNFAKTSDASRRALSFLLSQQGANGDWEGEMVWCTMILAQAIVVRTITNRPYSESERQAIIQQFRYYQREDGSFGMHPESNGYVFFTAMAYVGMRLLGLEPEHELTRKARHWLQQQPGGVKAVPTWGKFWLALVGLYEYEGLNSIPPEIFLLPENLPFHPRRFYCHTRLIYLGIAFLYGKRFVAPLPDSLRDELRQELYGEAYEQIPFKAYRNTIAKSDVLVPISPVLKAVYALLGFYESWHPQWLRKRGLAFCLEKIRFEQNSTRHQGISPVSGLLNCLALYSEDPHHPELAANLDALEAWRWQDEVEGLRYVGARSNTWDTAFALQAIAELPSSEALPSAALNQAHEFMRQAQMMEEIPDHDSGWRDPALGGWCFSDGQHRWPVSDCTAEALSALLFLYTDERAEIAQPFEPERLRLAVKFILSRQNADGGFGTYERRRAGKLLEAVNPSEMYGQCMTELSYVECTASSIAALSHYRQHNEGFAADQLDAAIARGVQLLRKAQLADGSFPGFWGINYTYAIFHVVKAFRTIGIAADDQALHAAAQWLLSKQKADGGWGEHYNSCLENRYIEHPQSQVVMTSWALLALLELLPVNHEAISRGFAWLTSQQQTDGGWPKQAVNGVFFGAAMLDYRLYHTYFPAWAVFRYNRLSQLEN